MTVLAQTVIAHQGGWDEILMVAGPLVVFAGVLFLANRRANQQLANAAETEAIDAEQIDAEQIDTGATDSD